MIKSMLDNLLLEEEAAQDVEWENCFNNRS